MSGHTATPWEVETPMGDETLWIVEAGKHVHEWRCIAMVCSDDPINDKDRDPLEPLTPEDAAANAAFIVTACNSHAELVKALEEIVKAYDSGNLEMRSPEIGEPENGIPYHEWHEEWLHHARAALATLTARKVG